MKIVCLFSDGSCLNNPGAGGWAYILEYKANGKFSARTRSGGVKETTNNQMELRAVIEGLKALKEPCEVRLFTDSTYVCSGINEWLGGWVKKDFKGVKNVPLWREYLKHSAQHKIIAKWLKAHAGHPQNEKCDSLARQAAIQIENQTGSDDDRSDTLL